MMVKKHIIPTWLYWTSLVIVILGGTQMLSGSLVWGITFEKNAAIILTISFLIVIIFDGVGMLIKEDK